ncbi:DUF2975 domain-containing protein [Zafaria sp. J156]|uniref:DUF2975 domain-containing protein n=1 Tax=Zafaria sp. J156 TaxID=3116490 RepID=UPI002E7623D3|nr:DUF2975 domain-containing protein [Zafaria sp. J156]MEE1622395.1 DUF2975 domain-containing protein [Zafaria sp. J156]
MERLLEMGLRACSAVSLVLAGLWVAGPFGLKLTMLNWLDHLDVLDREGPLAGIRSGPRLQPHFADRSLFEGLNDHLFEETETALIVPEDQNLMDILHGLSVQVWPYKGWDSLIFVALSVIPLLVAAVLAWQLANLVRDSRRQDVFTAANARRLTTAGLVIAAGSAALSVATWGFHAWLINTSTEAGRVIPAPFSMADVPWTAIGFGLVLIVLGGVWRRAVKMQYDVAGLV